MRTMETDRLIDDYLRRLEDAAAHLGRDRRKELVAEIREHIETAMQQESGPGEAAVRNVLDRLGPPEEIVAAAEPAAPPGGRASRGLEVVALVALLVPFIGWLIGIILTFASRIWSRRDKLIACVLLLVPVVVFGLGFTVARPSAPAEVPAADSPAVEEQGADAPANGPVELALFVAGVPTACYLAWRLRKDRPTSATERSDST
jgi:hypothetical protein